MLRPPKQEIETVRVNPKTGLVRKNSNSELVWKTSENASIYIVDINNKLDWRNHRDLKSHIQSQGLIPYDMCCIPAVTPEKQKVK